MKIALLLYENIAESECKIVAPSSIVTSFFLERSLVHCLSQIFEYKGTTVL